MSDIAKLLKRLTGADAASHLNDIRKLYEFCESPDLEVVAEALQAIPQVLSYHRQRTAKKGDASARKKISDWLQQYTEAYFTALEQLALSKDSRGQVCAIRLFMAAMQMHDAEANDLALDVADNVSHSIRAGIEKRLHHLLEELLLAETWSKHVVNCLNSEFIGTYIDIRHYILCHLKVCLVQVCKVAAVDDGNLSGPPSKKLKQNLPFADLLRSRGLPISDLYSRILQILKEAPEPGSAALANMDAADGEGAEHEVLAPLGRPASSFLKDYRRLYQEVWLQLLALRVPVDQLKPLLQLVSSRVMPHLSQPLMLADFYLRTFHSDNLEVCVASLSGLFLLLTKHSLGDPETLSSSSNEYYSQLYSLVKPETFLLKQHARFQRLLSVSLTSGLLPARFAAVFAKKCMCVAVQMQDAGTVMWLVAVTYSLIQTHHSHCRYLLHKESSHGANGEDAPKKDPFNASDGLNDALEKVSETSLWEVKLLQKHHVPAVSILLNLFDKPFFKPSSKKLVPETFLDQNIESLYNQALKSGDRQSAKWRARGQTCPLAFKVEEEELTQRLSGWAAALSTSQRRLGVGL